ncbi:NUMOD4 domain-containing protein [Bradyrhizobium stylosanthis]|uniref:HNH endonuclease n=1 Tax=Bradyrhizobium stylosanthis TaxID=1803665 RepID=A0A560CXI0_9BRAD|nr:NUMOD4 domain-containing protein [Bradyrhizobium stylosanthis]TWA89536.1 HNH endonuclease [Bradyrhizobium stylosanthis]
MTEEIWKPVVGFEGLYEVSNLGRVKSVGRTVYARTKLGDPLPRFQPERILSQHPHVNGYLLVHLYKGGKRKADTVHNLVAAAFIGPRPSGMQVAHDDGCPANCAASNLLYKTVQANIADKKRHGTHLAGEQCPMAVLTEADVHAIRQRPHMRSDDLGDMFGVSRSCINGVRAGRTWRHV